jgi:hypothetical protein
MLIWAELKVRIHSPPAASLLRTSRPATRRAAWRLSLTNSLYQGRGAGGWCAEEPCPQHTVRSCPADNPIVPTDLERCREVEPRRRQMLEIAEAGLDLEVGFVHVKGTQARHKSLGELVDAADRRSGPSRWRVARARVHRAHRRGGPRVRIPPSHPRTASPKEKKPALLWAPAASLGGNACARSGAPPARLRGEAHIATPWIRRCGDNPSSCGQILCQSTYRPPDCDLNSLVGRSCSDETSLSSRRGRRGRR